MLRRAHVVVAAVHVVPVVVDAAHAVEHVGLAVRVGLVVRVGHVVPVVA